MNLRDSFVVSEPRDKQNMNFAGPMEWVGGVCPSKAAAVTLGRGAMEWVCVYLTLVKNLPVLSVRDDDYKTEEACINANAGASDTFWCVTRNWLDKDQRKPVRAFVTD